MTSLQGTPLVILAIDGEPVNDRLLRCLDRLEVEAAWNRPALAILRFVDPQSVTLKNVRFSLGPQTGSRCPASHEALG